MLYSIVYNTIIPTVQYTTVYYKSAPAALYSAVHYTRLHTVEYTAVYCKSANVVQYSAIIPNTLNKLTYSAVLGSVQGTLYTVVASQAVIILWCLLQMYD